MIYRLNDKIIPSISEVGGKAKALMETSLQGQPVPSGVVLGVGFFEEWLKHVKSNDVWFGLKENVTQDSCESLKEEILNLEFTLEQENTIKKHLEELEYNIFSVRSSSPEEDLENISFAGMYETSLGVLKENVLKEIQHSFASCFDFRVLKYKEQNNVELDSSSIAVIVQGMINADTSGVGFSINPLNNSYDEVMINASHGLGEAVVSGIVTPDIYVHDTITDELAITISKKSKMLVINEGVVKSEVNPKESLQALSEAEIRSVSKLIKQCEEYYERPIDIEWAIEEGTLYLLQARPITTYVPLYEELVTAPGDEKLLYLDILSVTQGFSDPLSVLGSDIWKNIMAISGGNVLSCDFDGSSPVLHGRQFFNLFYLYKSLGKSIGESYISGHDESVKKILDTIDFDEYKLTKYPSSLKGAMWNMTKMAFRFMGPTIGSLFGSNEKQIKKYRNVYLEAKEISKSLSKNNPFNETVKNGIDGISKVIFSSGMVMAGVIASNKLKKMFKNYDVDVELSALSMSLAGNPTSEMGHLMNKMASMQEFVDSDESVEFVYKVSNDKYSQEFMDAFNDFMANHRYRTFREIDIASPRAHEDLNELFYRLKNINIEDNQLQKVEEKKRVAYETLLDIATENGFKRKFIKQNNVYQKTFGYREYPKYSTVTVVTEFRRVALEIAEELLEDKRIDNISDIFSLTIDEITEAQKSKELDLKECIRINEKPYELIKHVKGYPVVIDSRGKIFKPVLETKDGDLIGTSVAPGVVRGKAKVLNTPYEKQIEPGEILVTRSTEPSWTPIFINASGVVMELGGPLQHGGIIAREYGIPCVSGLADITSIIKDGDMLEVDGTSGVVRILD